MFVQPANRDLEMRISSESVSGRREGRRRDGNKDGEGGGPIAIAPSEKQGTGKQGMILYEVLMARGSIQ